MFHLNLSYFVVAGINEAESGLKSRSELWGNADLIWFWAGLRFWCCSYLKPWSPRGPRPAAAPTARCTAAVLQPRRWWTPATRDSQNTASSEETKHSRCRGNCACFAGIPVPQTELGIGTWEKKGGSSHFRRHFCKEKQEQRLKRDPDQNLSCSFSAACCLFLGFLQHFCT